MKAIPSDRMPDSTLALMREGYRFLSNRRAALGSDIFQTRLLLRKVICVSGRDAAEWLYDPARFIRHGAAPGLIQKTLTGQEGVQSLDGEAHRNRKAMFMSVMTRESLGHWNDAFVREWERRLPVWADAPHIVLFDEVQSLLCHAACHWAGVPLQPGEDTMRGRQMGAMVDGFATLGLSHWRAREARRQAERWMEDIIARVRGETGGGTLSVAPELPLHRIAWHEDETGRLLPVRIAAVEMLNLIRPITAIATYIAFLFLALHRHAECREALRAATPDYDEWFAQEVRRYYPFTPFVGALARVDCAWDGHRIPQGRRVLLDVYGMLHDPRSWDRPDDFMPERFRGWQPDPYLFLPQGGGEHTMHHRCAGEWLTIGTMKTACGFLARRMRYTVPEQDMGYSLSRIPSLPESRIAIKVH